MLRTKIKLVRWIGIILLSVLGIASTYAQAPDCDQCDIYIDDPILYAECVQEYCNDAIPVDNNIWILLVAGVGLAGYFFYTYQRYPEPTQVK